MSIMFVFLGGCLASPSCQKCVFKLMVQNVNPVTGQKKSNQIYISSSGDTSAMEE